VGKPNGRRNYSPKEQATMILMYRRGLSLREVAERFGTEATAIRAVLHRHGEPTRTKQEGVAMRANRSKEAVRKIIEELAVPK
jgi:transposase-like protein